MVWKIASLVALCCVPHFHLLGAQLLFTKWARTAAYPTLSAAAKNEKISQTPGRFVQIAWQ